MEDEEFFSSYPDEIAYRKGYFKALLDVRELVDGHPRMEVYKALIKLFTENMEARMLLMKYGGKFPADKPPFIIIKNPMKRKGPIEAAVVWEFNGKVIRKEDKK